MTLLPVRTDLLPVPVDAGWRWRTLRTDGRTDGRTATWRAGRGGDAAPAPIPLERSAAVRSHYEARLCSFHRARAPARVIFKHSNPITHQHTSYTQHYDI